MLKFSISQFLCDIRLGLPTLRHFHHEFSRPEPVKNDKDKESEETGAGVAPERALQVNPDKVPGALNRKYKIFRDEDATEIFDVEEERDRYQISDKPQQPIYDEYQGINLQRGLHGVYDVEDLVDVLRKESANDIFVCAVPKELKYVDYMVICNGRSFRHMLAIAEFVRRIYKVKRNSMDIMPKIEGQRSRDWMALDLGNIALHIFSPEAREVYDLESLWAIGSEYDKETHKAQDPLVELFETHSTLLADTYRKNNILDS